MSITISVDLDDISRGQRHASRNCPIAHAAERAGIKGPSVCAGAIVGSHKTYALPAESSDWLFAFDRGEPVAPITFEVVPE